MKATMAGVTVSPVNMEERRTLGMRAGDTVRVHQKIQDKGKTRIQIFEGTILARKHGDEPGATFTVRKVSGGIGVEKIYPLYSPLIDKLEIVRRSKVRKAKLYYIREKVAKEVKRQMRRMSLVSMTTESATEMAQKAAEEAKQAEAEAAAETARLEAEAKANAELEAKAAAEAEAAAAAEVTPEPAQEAPVEAAATEVTPEAEAPVATEEVKEEEKTA